MLRFIHIFALLPLAFAVRAAPASRPAQGPADVPRLLCTGSISLPADANGHVESHGWIIVPTPRAASLVHVPPRGPTMSSSGTVFITPPRSVHHTANLHEMPEAIAAWERSVYLIFPPSIAGESGADGAASRDRPRRVLTLSVFPAPFGAGWGADAGDRLTVLPPLDARGRLIGFVGTPLGPAALVQERDGDPTGPRGVRLVLLAHHVAPHAWIDIPIPHKVLDSMRPGLSARADLGWVQLTPHPKGLGIFTRSDAACGLWIAELPRDGSVEVGVIWQYQMLPRDVGSPDARIGPLHFVSGWLAYVRAYGDGSLLIRQITPEREITLARIDGVTSQYGVVPLDASSRLVVFSRQPDPPASRRTSSPGYLVHEVSTHTGRVLATGPADGSGPISRDQYRFLAIGLVVFTAIVLIIVLRPEEAPAAITLPEGTALAPPVLRVAAGIIDTGFALLLVRWFTPTLFPGLLAMNAAEGWLFYTCLLLAAGFLHCAIGEMLIGRSIGKALTGCRVVSVIAPPGETPPLRPPPPWAAIVRNLIRWTVPPVAWTFPSQPDLRHRGDRVAKTAVVVLVERIREPTESSQPDAPPSES